MPGRSGTPITVILASSRDEGDAGDDCLFHLFVFLESDQRAGVRLLLHRDRRVGKLESTRSRHLVLAGELHRADLQHLGAEARQLQHLLEGDGVQPARLGHDARVGGVDAVDVGVDLAVVGLERGGERDRRGVRAAAAERGDVAVVRRRPGSRRPRRRRPPPGPRADCCSSIALDARLGERAVGQDLHLRSRCSCAALHAELDAAPWPAGRR